MGPSVYGRFVLTNNVIIVWLVIKCIFFFFSWLKDWSTSWYHAMNMNYGVAFLGLKKLMKPDNEFNYKPHTSHSPHELAPVGVHGKTDKLPSVKLPRPPCTTVVFFVFCFLFQTITLQTARHSPARKLSNRCTCTCS